MSPDVLATEQPAHGTGKMGVPNSPRTTTTCPRYSLDTRTCANCGDKIVMKVSPVVAKAKVLTNTKAKISWKKVKGAERYVIYFAKCSKDKVTKIATTKNLSYVKSGLKKCGTYKFKVVAQRKVGGKWKAISTSYISHFISGDLTRGKGVTNTKKVIVNKKAVTIKAGKTKTLKAKVVGVKAGKKILGKTHAASVRYLSTDTDIAKVTRSGKITAKKAGTCTVYAIGVNGVWKAVKVTVK